MEVTLPSSFVTEKVNFYNFVMQNIFGGLILKKKNNNAHIKVVSGFIDLDPC